MTRPSRVRNVFLPGGLLFGAGVAMLTLALFPPRSEAHGTLPDVLQ